MEPSNFRYNPYDDIPTGVEITERHIIPANSPYYIRLNEVPQKTSPSTMQVKEVADIGTSVTYGQTFNEVAATPAAGEFWPDCNTGANGDENWNTGLIAFNAADAGKIIEVTYTGTGTLAGVNSNHWPSWYTDRGDGSDGDFVPNEDTTISGVKNYKSVFIKEGVTVTVDKYVLIKCQGTFINNGTITATGKGASGGAGGNSADAGAGNSGFSQGGAGGNFNDSSTNEVYKHSGAGGAIVVDGLPVSAAVANSIMENIPRLYHGGGGGGGGSYQGYSGGTGGTGGGCVIIVSKSFTNNGIISANGNAGSNAVNNTNASGGGGGGGGCVIAIQESLISQGTITVSGGVGGSGYRSGANGSDGFKNVKTLGM